jgi:hypothetical protein
MEEIFIQYSKKFVRFGILVLRVHTVLSRAELIKYLPHFTCSLNHLDGIAEELGEGKAEANEDDSKVR